MTPDLKVLMNQAKRSARVTDLLDKWWAATKVADGIKKKLQAAMDAEAPFKIGDVVAVTYHGYSIKIGKLPVTFPAMIHKGRVAAIFSNPKAGTIEYAVSPALFSGGYSAERRFTTTTGMTIEPWNSHHQYCVQKVLAERKRNGKQKRQRAGNAVDLQMENRVSPFLRDDWRSSRQWRSFISDGD